MRVIKSALLFLILFALSAPAWQYGLHLIREPALKGFFQLHEKPSLKLFTWKNWYSATFQDEFSTRLNDHVGLRNSLVRIHNQYNYSLFGLISAQGFVQGRDSYLYEEDYIHEYTGDYFIGKAVIDKKLARLKNVMDSLKAYHIPLLLVYEPGKASFYPEYIPHRFHPEKRGLTNFAYYLQRCRELGLPFLDLNDYFLKMKDTSPYPLFPRYGMHWSVYGVPLAVDTLSKSIEKYTATALPKFKTERLDLSPTPRGTDNDIGELLNLWGGLKPAPGAYPVVSFEKSPSAALKVLIIADSYYLNIAGDYGRQMFRVQDYWYYNKKVYPYQNNLPPLLVDKTNLRDKLKKYDVILLLTSEINLHCGFWNFADEAYTAFHPGVKDPLIYGIENDIRNEREWFRSVVKKAKGWKKPVEEVVRADAEYMFFNNYNNFPDKGYQDSIQYLALNIRNNGVWYAQVVKKAETWKIPVDTMLMMDARYSYEQSKKKH